MVHLWRTMTSTAIFSSISTSAFWFSHIIIGTKMRKWRPLLACCYLRRSYRYANLKVDVRGNKGLTSYVCYWGNALKNFPRQPSRLTQYCPNIVYRHWDKLVLLNGDALGLYWEPTLCQYCPNVVPKLSPMISPTQSQSSPKIETESKRTPSLPPWFHNFLFILPVYHIILLLC